ncbi:MAG: cell division protein FtsQ/DivIB [Clostridiales bacterium]|nr:cell division protein FtsQ/DivIB [Clostridiales bacterium]MDY4113519.1 cell division protein FtsQ/DivIB [Roseburia sp.]
MIREQRKRKKRRKIGLIIFLIFVLLIALAVLIVWKVFTVKEVKVEGNELYSSEQIEQLVLNDEYSWNSLYVVVKYSLWNTEDVPFLDTMEVSLEDPHTVRISVYEKGMLGCFYIDTIGQYAYFDKDGFVVETSSEEIPGIPKITGITCQEVVLYEQLPLEQEEVLDNLLNLTQILKKYDLLPQEIHYDENLEPTLTYYGTRVVVGSDEYLTQKVVRLSAIMPELAGLYGTLYLDSWTPDTTEIIYKRDE